MRSGFRSTEFYLCLAVIAAAVAGVSEGALYALAGMVATYTGGRSFVKAKSGIETRTLS